MFLNGKGCFYLFMVNLWMLLKVLCMSIKSCHIYLGCFLQTYCILKANCKVLFGCSNLLCPKLGLCSHNYFYSTKGGQQQRCTPLFVSALLHYPEEKMVYLRWQKKNWPLSCTKAFFISLLQFSYINLKF